MPNPSAIERAAPATSLVGAAPRPWRLHTTQKKGHLDTMTVYAADGEVVEYRCGGGHTPETFARHVANAEHYVAVVNAAEKSCA